MQTKNYCPFHKTTGNLSVEKPTLCTSELGNSFTRKVTGSHSASRFKPQVPSSIARIKHLFFLFQARCLQSDKALNSTNLAANNI